MGSMSIHPKSDTKVEADVHQSLHGKVAFTIVTEDGDVTLFLTPYQAQQLIDTAQLTLNGWRADQYEAQHGDQSQVHLGGQAWRNAIDHPRADAQHPTIEYRAGR